MRVVSIFVLLFVPVVTNANLIWKAERGGDTVYLLAEIPFTSPGMPAHVDGLVNEALEDSKVVVFVSDPQPAAESTVSTQLGSLGVYGGDDSLTKNIPAALDRQIKEVCSDLNIPIANFSRLKPWFAAKALYPVASVRSGIRIAERFDRHMHRTAVNMEKDIAYLLKTQDIADRFLSMDDNLQVEFLGATLTRIRNFPNDLVVMENAWRFSDVQTIERRVNGWYQSYPSLRAKWLQAQNDTWSSQLISLAAVNGNVLAILPVDCLVGEGSIPALLAERGFAIELVKPK